MPQPIIGPRRAALATVEQENDSRRALYSSSAAATLGGIVDSILNIVGQIQQASNSPQLEGLQELSTQIKRLTPVVPQIVGDDPNKDRATIQNLRREVALMTEELEATGMRHRLNSITMLEIHNTALDLDQKMDVLVMLQNFNKFVRELVDLKKSQSYHAQSHVMTATVLGDNLGETGGAVSDRHIGGEGGEGGPQLHIDPEEQ
ncbi:hypothetical protein MSAN_02438600 [Mycena sanguinolenta]|uniref:Uncharacterized protein n=1 Tax=Mycena sanguinolenta TaxID=230812 RepID=A0A8H6WYX2_9AGAR|nr:hypothetical protein MSAN_02438600 [Mycena sanguinolenta]